MNKIYIESYGCQMNFSDSEIIISLLTKQGFTHTTKIHDAEIILLNTCAIREKAVKNIKQRLLQFKLIKKKIPIL